MNRIRKWLMIASAYLALTGLITFSLFIHEEALQTSMFSSWAAKNAQRWDIVLQGADLMRGINLSMKIINYTLGWIQPLALFSYLAYGKSADLYISAIEAECFAHEPGLFVGREVVFIFHPKRIERTDDGKYVLTDGRIAVVSDQSLSIKQIPIAGTIVQGEKYLIVEQEK